MAVATHSSFQTPSQSKRAITETETFFMITFSLFGNWKAVHKLIYVEAVLELLDIDVEMVATWIVAMQNLIASKTKRLEQ